jgi:hypothetical protein
MAKTPSAILGFSLFSPSRNNTAGLNIETWVNPSSVMCFSNKPFVLGYRKDEVAEDPAVVSKQK